MQLSIYLTKNVVEWINAVVTHKYVYNLLQTSTAEANLGIVQRWTR